MSQAIRHQLLQAQQQVKQFAYKNRSEKAL